MNTHRDSARLAKLLIALLCCAPAGARAADLVRGQALFATCAACHNVDGSGMPDGSVPAIAGQYRAVIVADYASQLVRHATRNVGDGGALAAGTSLYFRKCQGCHGALGEGSEARLTPRLGGQHYAYLARQIRFAGDRRRPNMAAAHERLVRALTLDEIKGVADYLSRLDPAATRRPPAP